MLAHMAAFTTFQQLLVLLLVAAHALALGVIVFRHRWRGYPAFSVYIFLNLLQGAVLMLLYRTSGVSSTFTSHFAWATQAAILCARAMVIREVCKHLLSWYRGIWALTWRILAGTAVFLVLYSLIAAGGSVRDAVLIADLGLELTIAVVLTLLFLFARYYEIEADSTLRSLAIGLFLFSCCTVLNNTVMSSSVTHYYELWNILSGLAFLASLLLWTWAFYAAVPSATPENLLPAGVYHSLVPEVNSRLRRLNDDLTTIFDREGHQR